MEAVQAVSEASRVVEVIMEMAGLRPVTSNLRQEVTNELCGTRAIMTRDMARYRHCHTAWHLVLPLGLAAFNGYRWRAAQLEGRCRTNNLSI